MTLRRHAVAGHAVDADVAFLQRPVSSVLARSMQRFGVLCALMFGASAASAAVVEAESGALSGGALVQTDHAGYTGSGFVGGFTDANKGNARVGLTVNVANAGTYSLGLRFANGTGGPRTLSLYVNGTRLKQTVLNATANWDSWGTQTESVTLNAGNNTLAYKYDTTDSGNVNVDSLNVSGGGGGGGTPADLIVTGLTWTPASPQAGNAVAFTATIKNQGGSATPAIKHGVNFTVDGAQVAWSDNDTASLAPGASITLTA